MILLKKIVIIFVAIQVLDIITTIIGLRFLGFQEANTLLPAFGWAKMNMLKFLGSAFIVLSLTVGYKYMPRLSTFYGVIVTIVAAVPVVNNIILILSEV